MRTHKKVRGFYRTACLLGFAIGQSGLPAATPKGLSNSDWSAIRKEHVRHRQAAIAVEGGWKSQNLRQNWSTRFDGHGFEVTPAEGSWRWGLKLTAFGYQGQQRRVQSAKLQADLDTVSYQWDSDLREWFVNGEGLEHGFTLAARPGKGTGLQFHFDVRGTLKPRVAPDGASVQFADRETGNAVVSYDHLKVTDATGRTLSARFEAQPRGLRLNVDDADAHYPITVDPLAQQTSLRASNAESGDAFGFSVAIDGKFVVVGAPFERSNGTSESDNSLLAAGAAYVFFNGSSGWIQIAYLKASNPAPGNLDRFGYSVGINGNRIVVGAPEKTVVIGGQSRTAAGYAYVFMIDIPFCAAGGVFPPGCQPGSVTPEATLQGSYGLSVTPRAGDRFGWSVAIGRDPATSPEGDTIVVGSPRYDGIGESPFVDSGAAFIFTRSSSTWTAQNYLESPLPLNGGFYGTSVAISGTTVVVGEPQNGAVTFGGRAYVYEPSGGVWSQQAVLSAANAQGFDGFGTAVAIDGTSIVVGAPFEDSDGTSPANNGRVDSGAAYLFTRAGSLWTQADYFKASNPGNSEQFGSYVAVSGDTALAGGPNGRVFWYRSGVRTQLTATLGGNTLFSFGCSAAANAGRFAVGACNDVTGFPGGNAYVFAEAVTLSSITISASPTSIPKGTTVQFTATGNYSDGSQANITSQVTWQSENLTKVTINSSGLATGIGVGFSNITASLPLIQSNTISLIVTNPVLVSIAITAPNTHLAGGATEQFVATGTYTDATTANLTSQVLWNSSNPASVTIASTGAATAVSLGSSNITASLTGITSNTFALSVDCAANITPQVTVTRGPLTRNFVTGNYTGQVMVTNTGPNTFAGPVSLVLDNLSPTATLLNSSGTASCNLPSGPYINANMSIPPGQQVTFLLQFASSGGAITYSTRVLAGPLPK